MKKWAVVFFIVIINAPLHAEKVWSSPWSKLREQGALTVGQIIPPDTKTPAECLKLENRTSQSATVPLATIQNPAITQTAYAVAGRVRYEGVEGTAYLEMYGYLAAGKKMTVRTLGTGKLKGITGDSDWREFYLPLFIGGQAKMRPVKIDVNLIFPGKGTIYLQPLQLHQFRSGGKCGAQTGTSPVMHGAVVPIFILYAAVLGVIGMMLFVSVQKGESRSLVLNVMMTLIVTGCIGLLIGTIVLIAMGDRTFFGPFRLLAVIQTAVPAAVYSRVRKYYDGLGSPDEEDARPKRREEKEWKPPILQESEEESHRRQEPEEQNANRKGLSDLADWDWEDKKDE